MLPSLPKPQRVLQLGRRGAITTVLLERLTSTFDFALYEASQVEAVMKDIKTHHSSVLLVASHDSQATLALGYDKDYISAIEAIETVLTHVKCKSLSSIVTISGGIPQARLQDLNTPLLFELILSRRFASVLDLAAPTSKRCSFVNYSGDLISFVQEFPNRGIYCCSRGRFSAVQRH